MAKVNDWTRNIVGFRAMQCIALSMDGCDYSLVFIACCLFLLMAFVTDCHIEKNSNGFDVEKGQKEIPNQRRGLPPVDGATD
ncbi:hypothetical protein [Acetobacter aceti]|uniref:Uncharacterized protein n=1 Tax=Acetobacter aceti TaxID=435 RepID=A0A6S6PP11_ACEAC|nr:hypothetical protein [Acetobacter aceti]BCI68820.1 hypothetical protein AAJCM20276_34440 [Acetobacter aceti]